ncbi:unnamed protein product [Angiostrongylus costaricensis]|uniref:MFS domain-containing protein n=1 Tax=Angiostrongylus costaricensis TaxID=334426 RepID=A0A158PF11_ANGCS|nr:unnamed protein product [Angiostrongylus costaricensis]
MSRHWLNDPTKKNLLFSVVAIGQLLGTLPVVPALLTCLYRYTFSLYGILTAFATLAIPIAVDLGHGFLTAMRILQGFSMGIVFVSVGAITSHWSVHRESGTYIAILSCSPQLAAVLTMPLAGAFCGSFSWRSLYYSFGMFGVLSTALFFLLYREDPKKHRFVSARELKAISTGKEGQVVRGPVPYKEICKDPCIQSVILSSLGGNTGFFIFLHFGPTFMNKVRAMGIDVADTGFATALPYALAVALKFVAGPLFDISTFISEKNRLIMFSSLSQGVMGFCFFVISQVKPGKVKLIAIYSARHLHNQTKKL